MMNRGADFSPNNYEQKWARQWMEKRIYRANDGDPKPKSYVLIEFPYPSGERLHVGHARSYSCLDAVARMRRMKGMNVMFPFGWDAFGLPAENYAIKTGIHPALTTKENIDNARKQAIAWGLSFDWDREVDTTDSNYYKWTQWIFIQLFNKGLAYKSEIAVNWCPSCKTNLANEEVIDGKCERCGTETERKKQSQWLLRITAYVDRLLTDLETVDFREDIKAQQVNWIGKKEGVNIRYEIVGKPDEFVEVFTTRPDTNFGATFIVIAPEHELAIKAGESNEKVRKYIEKAVNKSDRERLVEGKKKTGEFTGVYVLNNLTGEKMPVWVADFVLADFGTGAVVGVPGHDKRDFEFAREFGLPIKRVVVGDDGDTSEIAIIEQVQEDEGKMVNSGFLDGLDIHEATEKVMNYLEERGWGTRSSSYHLRDWVFSRQHYWGEPIPMVYCEKDGWVPVGEADLPVKLPQIEKFQPSGTGESPLAQVESFVKTTCPTCGGPARRETDTMPNWAGSSWYFLRYCDVQNNRQLAGWEKLKYWLPVDWYNGGMEHTTLHLLYSRFWHKFLFDLGVVPTTEPYAKRTSHGVVLGPDNRKMSKSRGNVINPDEVVKKYGADTLRMYEMFIGPFEQMVTWSWEGVEGVHRFLKRTWSLASGIGELPEQSSKEGKKRLARLIQKVENDLEATKFNTAVAACMEFVNWWSDTRRGLNKEGVEVFLKVLAPMAPFISEELYQRLMGESANLGSIHIQNWPVYDLTELEDDVVTVVVQVNGKVRGKVELGRDVAESEEKVQTEAVSIENVRKFVPGKYRVVFVPGKVINLITE